MNFTERLSIVNVKALLTRAAVAGVVAGAAFLAAPQKANAQVAFGVQFGRPVYRGPVYRGPAYRRPVYAAPVYGPRYYAPAPVVAYGYGYSPGFGYDRHLAWERHERWEHERGFYR